MGRGLSDLQRWILIHALDPKPEPAYHGKSQVGETWYSGYWRLPEEGRVYYQHQFSDDNRELKPERSNIDITSSYIVKGYYRSQTLTRGKVSAAARVAVSVTLDRLENAGSSKGTGAGSVVRARAPMATA